MKYEFKDTAELAEFFKSKAIQANFESNRLLNIGATQVDIAEQRAKSFAWLSAADIVENATFNPNS